MFKNLFSLSEECFFLANNTDPDEMRYNAKFHQGLYSLPEYLFWSVLSSKG